MKKFLFLSLLIVFLVVFTPATAFADNTYTGGGTNETNAVVVDLNQPDNSSGVVTISGGGYFRLIDSNQQSREVQIRCTGGDIYLIVEDITVDTSNEDYTIALSFSGTGNFLLLDGDSSFESGFNYPGISVLSDVELTIDNIGSGGQLTAQGGLYGAGIGTDRRTGGSTGTIIIAGGQVTATGGDYGAGIGGGYGVHGGIVTVTGGQVTAQGGSRAAGIGGSNQCDGGITNILGGQVIALGGNFGAAGIGGGTDGSCNRVFIFGDAKVYAAGSGDAMDIGKGGSNTQTRYNGSLEISDPNTAVFTRTNNHEDIYVPSPVSGYDFVLNDGIIYSNDSGDLNTVRTIFGFDSVFPWTDAQGVYSARLTVTYDGNIPSTGSEPADTNSPYFPTALVMVLSNTGNLAKTGYTFDGWRTSVNGGTVYQPNDTFNINDNITLYANWKAHTYTVSFNGDGSDSGSMTDQSFIYDTAQNLTDNEFTKAGHSFEGWATSSGGTVVYADGESVNNFTAVDGDIVALYAKWTASPLEGTITIDHDGTPEPGEVLAVNTTGITNNTGILSYQWKRGTTNIGTNSSTYTIETSDTGQGISVTVTSDVQTGFLLSDAVVIPFPIPSAPQNFTATARDEEVALSWIAPADDGGIAITGYEVSSDNATTWEAADTDTSHIFTGLTNGTEYTFAVRAVNAVVTGTPATTTATPMMIPSAPQNFTATARDEEVSLRWSAPADDGGSSITNYLVSSDNGTTWVNADTDISHTFTGLTNGIDYTFAACAVNLVGNGTSAVTTSKPCEARTVPINTTVYAYNPSSSILVVTGSDLFLSQLNSFSINGIYIPLDRTDPSMFTFSGGNLQQGSIIVTLAPAYVRALIAGNNEMVFIFNNGGLIVTSNFTISNANLWNNNGILINENPQTGDISNPPWAAITTITMVIALLAFMLKKRFLKAR